MAARIFKAFGKSLTRNDFESERSSIDSNGPEAPQAVPQGGAATGAKQAPHRSQYSALARHRTTGALPEVEDAEGAGGAQEAVSPQAREAALSLSGRPAVRRCVRELVVLLADYYGDDAEAQEEAARFRDTLLAQAWEAIQEETQRLNVRLGEERRRHSASQMASLKEVALLRQRLRGPTEPGDMVDISFFEPLRCLEPEIRSFVEMIINERVQSMVLVMERRVREECKQATDKVEAEMQRRELEMKEEVSKLLADLQQKEEHVSELMALVSRQAAEALCSGVDNDQIRELPDATSRPTQETEDRPTAPSSLWGPSEAQPPPASPRRIVRRAATEALEPVPNEKEQNVAKTVARPRHIQTKGLQAVAREAEGTAAPDSPRSPQKQRETQRVGLLPAIERDSAASTSASSPRVARSSTRDFRSTREEPRISGSTFTSDTPRTARRTAAAKARATSVLPV